jgi:hypothetical protein
MNITEEQIKSEAELYAEKFRLVSEDGGWFQQKVNDFTAGYNAALQKLKQCNVSGSLPPADVRKKANKIGNEFKRKWEAKYVGFGDGSTIELWWRHQIENAFGGNDR